MTRPGSTASSTTWTSGRPRGAHVRYLAHRDADGVQRLVILGDDVTRLTVGRSPDADVPLTWDREVSRDHAGVERAVDGWSASRAHRSASS